MRPATTLSRRVQLAAGLAAAALLTFSGCGETAESETLDLSGVWSGEWLSPGAGAGGVVVVLDQTGNYISGEMQIEGNICSPDSVIQGNFDPASSTVTFTLVDPNNADHRVSMTGPYRPATDTIDVTFMVDNWEICTGAAGSMNFQRY